MYSAQLYGEDLSVYKRVGLNLTFYKSFDGVSAPQGTEATPNGWWYVANSGASNVLVFKSTKSGPTGPVTTLDDSSEFPNNVSATPSRRLVAVSNYQTVGGGAGSVSVYLARQTQPARILKYGNDPIEGAGVAIDHQGNCFFSFNDPNNKSGSVVEFIKCNGAGQVVVPTIASAGGIAFDQSGDLYYVDKTAGIYRCKKTSQCALLPAVFGLPVNINFDLKDKYLWVADASGYIDAVDPTTGAIVYQKAAEGGPTDPPFGIAPAPGG
jgi:DNA-binding beta-propeller fold protein YncE